MSPFNSIVNQLLYHMKKIYFRSQTSAQTSEEIYSYFDIFKIDVETDKNEIFDIIENIILLAEPRLRSLVKVRSDKEEFLPPRRKEGKDLFRWVIENIFNRNYVEISKVETIDPEINTLCGEISKNFIARPTVTLAVVNGETKKNIEINFKRDTIFLCLCGKFKIFDMNISADFSPGEAFKIKGEKKYFIESTEAISFAMIISINFCGIKDIAKTFIDTVTAENNKFRRTVFIDSAEADVLVNKSDFLSYARNKDFFEKAMNNLLLELSDTYRVSPKGHIRALTLSRHITMDTLFKRRTGSNMVIVERKDDLRIFIPGCGQISVSESFPSTISFPKEAREILEGINNTNLDFTLRDLSPKYSDSSKIATARKLLNDGFLCIVEV